MTFFIHIFSDNIIIDLPQYILILMSLAFWYIVFCNMDIFWKWPTYARQCSCRLTVTRRMSLVEQELLTLPWASEITSVLEEVRSVHTFVVCILMCVNCLSLFSSIVLNCMFLVELRLIVTSLVPSIIFSYRNAHLVHQLNLIW